jgi:hypothetical protein
MQSCKPQLWRPSSKGSALLLLCCQQLTTLLASDFLIELLGVAIMTLEALGRERTRHVWEALLNFMLSVKQ